MRTHNFGDDLNKLIWHKLISNLDQLPPDIGLLGIGTLQGIKLPKSLRCILVMGTGGLATPPGDWFDSRFKVYFCRGLLTEKSWGCPGKGIVDGAYLSKFTDLIDLCKAVKKYEYGFMPHHISDRHANYSDICSKLGFKYISPRNPDIQQTIQEIGSCGQLITEALHGAIFSDILGVPWTPVNSGNQVYQFKWDDWTQSIGLNYCPTTITYPFTRGFSSFKLMQNKFKYNLSNLKIGKSKWGGIKYSFQDNSVNDIAAHEISQVAKQGQFFLSSDIVKSKIYSQLSDVLHEFNKDLKAL